MKKNNLFKVVGIVILGYVLLTWLVPIIAGIFGETESLSYQIGFTSEALALIETFSGFGNPLIFVLLVGGFYGILEATGMYEKSLNSIANKFKGKEKVFLIAIMALMAIISSVSGLELGLLMIFPFVISLILMMGYDKLVALCATFGATVIGMFGATLSGTMYGVNSTFLGTELTSQILAKIILFVLGFGLLLAFVLLYLKKSNKEKHIEKKNNKDERKTVKVIVKKSEKKEENKKEKKNKTDIVWPIYLVLGLVFVVFFLGTSTFTADWFANAHEAIMGWTIKDFAPVSKIFGGIDALGTWNTPYRFQYYSVLLIFAMVILCVFYRIKLSDAFESFVKGVREYVVPALLCLLAYSVFVITYYYPVLTYLTGLITGITDSFNVALTGVSSLISSVFYSDYYYYAYYVMYSFTQTLEDTSVLPLAEIIYTSLYGLVMLIGPTSALLLTSLSITEVSYKEWVKFIWKLFLSLLVVAFIVFVIMLLI